MSRGRVITKSLLLAAALTWGQIAAAADPTADATADTAADTAADPAATATPCALNGVQPVPVLETAKAHFLRGEYPQFFRVSTPFVIDAEARYAGVMGKLPVLFKDGFADCTTVLQRRDAGGMVQEMTLFTVRPPASGMMSLLLTSAPIGGKEMVIFMTFNSQMTNILQELH